MNPFTFLSNPGDLTAFDTEIHGHSCIGYVCAGYLESRYHGTKIDYARLNRIA